jgi:hypothetical protein
VSSDNSGVNTLFSIENILYASGELYFHNFDLVSYTVARQYIGTLDYLIGSKTQVLFSDANNQITVYPTPAIASTLMLEVYNVVDSAEYFDHNFVKKYALACAKVIWSTITSKIRVTLPGGGELNMEGLKSDGIQEMKDSVEDLRNTYETPPRFFVG